VIELECKDNYSSVTGYWLLVTGYGLRVAGGWALKFDLTSSIHYLYKASRE
jgi:hypothetical protein